MALCHCSQTVPEWAGSLGLQETAWSMGSQELPWAMETG